MPVEHPASAADNAVAEAIHAMSQAMQQSQMEFLQKLQQSLATMLSEGIAAQRPNMTSDPTRPPLTTWSSYTPSSTPNELPPMAPSTSRGPNLDSTSSSPSALPVPVIDASTTAPVRPALYFDSSTTERTAHHSTPLTLQGLPTFSENITRRDCNELGGLPDKASLTNPDIKVIRTLKFIMFKNEFLDLTAGADEIHRRQALIRCLEGSARRRVLNRPHLSTHNLFDLLSDHYASSSNIDYLGDVLKQRLKESSPALW